MSNIKPSKSLIKYFGRDPRFDPKEGDVFYNNVSEKKIVIDAIHGGAVFYRVCNLCDRVLGLARLDIHKWRSSAPRLIDGGETECPTCKGLGILDEANSLYSEKTDENIFDTDESFLSNFFRNGCCKRCSNGLASWEVG